MSPAAVRENRGSQVVDGDPTDGHTGLARVRDRLVDGITAAVQHLPAGELVEVTLPLLRRAATHPATVGQDDGPFAWKPVFARRSLGLAAVQACAEGRFRGPAEAVGPLAAHAVDEWRRTGWRTFHWEPWFAGLGAGARAAVLAEAATWASPLWASADWCALRGRSRIGGTDDLWTCPGPRTVRLKGRCEARVAATTAAGPGDGPGTPGPALVSVSCGIPRADWAAELAYLALVAALRDPDQPVPARVVGLWPEAGMRRTAEIDEHLLADSADRVIGAVGLVARAHVGTDGDGGGPVDAPRA